MCIRDRSSLVSYPEVILRARQPRIRNQIPRDYAPLTSTVQQTLDWFPSYVSSYVDTCRRHELTGNGIRTRLLFSRWWRLFAVFDRLQGSTLGSCFLPRRRPPRPRPEFSPELLFEDDGFPLSALRPDLFTPVAPFLAAIAAIPFVACSNKFCR